MYCSRDYYYSSRLIYIVLLLYKYHYKILKTEEVLDVSIFYGVTIRGIYIKGQIYKELLKVIAAMVLKYIKFTSATNRETDTCMKKEKRFQNVN